MRALEELGIDTIGQVSLPEKGWQQAAKKLIEDRRKQLSAASRRIKTERQAEALDAELKRIVDLESYVRACEYMEQKSED
jgi:hypothetical protein